MENEIVAKRASYWAKEPTLTGNHYKGVVSRAKEGVHEHVVEWLSKRLPSGASALDLATGEGALALRLKDAGYAVTASDYVVGSFKLKDVPFVQADLNQAFNFGRFDCVVASEIIEHLENPRHFLRECAKVAPLVVITTPNTDSPVSKALYVRESHWLWFNQSDYETMGHIMPVSPTMLRQCAAETGFSVETLHTFGSAWEGATPKMRLLARALALIDRGPKELRGEILIAALSSRP
jgi:ubiquinone/menaquinone biosynthesis C-methylase UbiE